MAYRHVYVDPDATDTPENGTTWGKAYASLNAAEQAEDNSGNIDSSNEIVVFHCRSSAGTADTAAVSVDGWTTSADDYIVIVAETIDTSYGGGASETTGTGRHHGVWSDTHYRLNVTDAGPLTIAEQYVRVEGLQISTPIGASPANGRHAVYISVAATNRLDIGHCLIKGHASGTYTQSGIYGDVDMALTLYNTIIYNIPTIASSYAVLATCASAGIYGCTVIGGSYGVRTTTGTVTTKNTYIGGTGTEAFNRNTGTLVKVNCASSDGSADDTSGGDETATNCLPDILYDTTEGAGHAGFTNVGAGTENYTLKSGSALVGVGTTLTDDPPGATALALDIAGNARS